MYSTKHCVLSSLSFILYAFVLAWLTSSYVDAFLATPAQANWRMKLHVHPLHFTHKSRQACEIAPKISCLPLFSASSNSDLERVIDMLNPGKTIKIRLNEDDDDPGFEPEGNTDLELAKHLHSKFMKNIAKGILPLTTSVGFAVTPSSSVPLRVAGAAAGGLVGFMAKRSILSHVEEFDKLLEPEEPLKDVAYQDVYEDQLDGVNQKHRVLEKLSEGIIPAAVYAGFAVVPSHNIFLRCLGAITGWVGGVLVESVSKDRLITRAKEKYRTEVSYRSELPPAVLNAIDALREVKTPWEELTSTDLCAIARRCKVSRRHIDLFLSLAVSEVVCAAVKIMDPDLFKNLAGVLRFASNGNLPYLAITNGLAFAAIKIGEQLPPSPDGTGVFADEFEPETLIQAAKVLFLSQKLFVKKRGYYEGKLVPALAYFPPIMYKSYLTSLSTILYEELCRCAFKTPERYTDETVPAYTEFLTVSEDVSNLQPKDMLEKIEEAIQDELNENMSPSSPPLDAYFKDFNRLQRGCELLGVTGKEFNYTVMQHTETFFQEAAPILVQKVVERPELAMEMQAKMIERLTALKLEWSSATTMIHHLVPKHHQDFCDRVIRIEEKASETSPEGSAEIEIWRAVSAYAHVFAALQKFAAPFTHGKPLTPPTLPFDFEMRSRVLQARAESTGSAKSVTEIEKAMLDLYSDHDEDIDLARLAIKSQDQFLETIRSNKFNLETKEMYLSNLRKCDVSDEELFGSALKMFHDEMERLPNRPVPTQDEMDRIEKVRDFLDLKVEHASHVYRNKFGEKYAKAVRESMASSEGTNSAEYADGLQRLRTRLCLSVDDAMTIFNSEAKSRITPILASIIDVWQLETNASYVRQNAHEPPKVFLREVVNLLDVHDEIYCLVDNEGGIPQDKRVTALGQANPKQLVELYKHFLLHRISEPDPDARQRYLARSPAFVRFLGIEPTEQEEKIRLTLAIATYNRLLGNVLRTHDTVDYQHVQQFQYLKDGLELSDAEAEYIYTESTKLAIVENAKALVNKKEKGSKLTANDARRIRMQVASLGMDLEGDVGFPHGFVTVLFALEVQQLVETECDAQIEEVRDAYKIEAKAGHAIVESVCRQHLTSVINRALRALDTDDVKGALAQLKAMLRYAKYISSGTVEVDGSSYREAHKNMLIALYSNEVRAGTDPEIMAHAHAAQGVDVAERLREIIELNPSFYVDEEDLEELISNKARSGEEDSED